MEILIESVNYSVQEVLGKQASSSPGKFHPQALMEPEINLHPIVSLHRFDSMSSALLTIT